MTNAEYQRRYYQKHKDRYRERSRLWRLANPDKVRASNLKHGRGARLKSRYNITEADYNKMLAAQGYTCAVPTCRATSPGGGQKNFHVDHCHTTNRVRGLICLRCNTMLSKGRDNRTFLLGIIEYLESDQ